MRNGPRRISINYSAYKSTLSYLHCLQRRSSNSAHLARAIRNMWTCDSLYFNRKFGASVSLFSVVTFYQNTRCCSHEDRILNIWKPQISYPSKPRFRILWHLAVTRQNSSWVSPHNTAYSEMARYDFGLIRKKNGFLSWHLSFFMFSQCSF
jgi:hypothetical protein